MDTERDKIRQLIEQLDQLGFSKHINLNLLAEVKAEAIEVGHPYCAYHPYFDEQPEPLKKIYRIDLEDIVEGRAKEFILKIQPFLKAEKVYISEIEAFVELT